MSLLLKNKPHYVCVFSPNRPSYIGIMIRPTFAIECQMLHSSADLFSQALCISEDSLLRAEDKTYIIHGGTDVHKSPAMRRSMLNKVCDCPADLRQAT